MLSRKRQQEYFLERLESVLHHYELFTKQNKAHNIHKMRVDLKKIRALLYLYEFTGVKVNKSTKRFVRGIFQQAGKIRDAQISASLLKKMNSGTSEFFRQQRKIAARESKKLIRKIGKQTGEMIGSCEAQWNSIQRISGKQIRKFNTSLLKEITSAYKPDLKTTLLHASRKSLKRLIYINAILNEKFRSEIDLNAMRQLEEAVGKWHDTQVTAKLLCKHSAKPSVLKLLAKKERTQLLRVEQVAKKYL